MIKMKDVFKIQTVVMALVLTLVINAVTYLPMGDSEEVMEAKEHSYSQKLGGMTGEVVEYEVSVDFESNVTVELFMIQNMDENGYLIGKPFEEGVEGMYVFNNEYELGDIVEVITVDGKHDEPVSERKLRGAELEQVEEQYNAELSALMDEGYSMVEHVEAEDGSIVPVSYYQ